MAVVTDSTSALPSAVVEKYDVTVVPLQVVLGNRVGAEGVDVAPADVASALTARAAVSTSRPSPQAFADAYRRLTEDGVDLQHVVFAQLDGLGAGARLLLLRAWRWNIG